MIRTWDDDDANGSIVRDSDGGTSLPSACRDGADGTDGTGEVTTGAIACDGGAPADWGGCGGCRGGSNCCFGGMKEKFECRMVLREAALRGDKRPR